MSLRAVTQLHENEALVSAAQSAGGQLVVWVTASLLLLWHDVSFLMIVALGLVMLLPAQRRMILSFAAAGTILEMMMASSGMTLQRDGWLLGTLLAAGIGGLYAAFFGVRHFDRWPAFVRQFPIITLHLGIWGVLCLSTLPALAALAMVPFLSWRLSYLVMHGVSHKPGNTRFRDHLFYLVPVYGGTLTPYGKGADFLSRREAGDRGAFARSQLAGIKLLVLAALWAIALDLFDTLLFGQASRFFSGWPATWTLGWTRLTEQLVTASYPPWYQGWITVYLELIRSTLRIAVIGHVIVGCLRLLGFNVFRNTYKPLLAESIVEFWNRYYYYFKEVLVDFFFYPTFIRLRALSPSIRMLGAVFAAAFVGNMYHHVLSDPDTLLRLDVAGFWAQWGARFFYCFLLALGVWASMMRQQKVRLEGPKKGLFPRLRRIAGVWTYFGIIQIWTIAPDGVSIADVFELVFTLVGIR